MENLKNIIRNAGMSTRPEYYSGRGATRSDLDEDILEKIFKGIEAKFGALPAENFVKMIDDIKVLSATTFLQELYNLYYSNWKYTKKKKHSSGVAVGKNADGEYDLASGLIGMMGAMSGMNDRDDTQRIKGWFLRCHGILPKAEDRMRDANGNTWY